ncbi:MAG: Lin0512 family protein [Chloroflexi bacterium]|nr:Lin0512 family protein [Chloroflexota bacterium]MCL5109537.1 Lin0512 family protein [Chloroflexota bacterium]
MRRLLIEFGNGIDQHGQSPTDAAMRAIKDAISWNYLVGLRELLALDDVDKMVVRVTIATPYPERVDREALAGALPHGQKQIEVVPGGMLYHSGHASPRLGDKNDEVIVANAAIEVGVAD